MLILKPGEVHVWFRRTATLGSEFVASADRYLSIEERARRDRFRFEADRRDFTLAHDLLRRSLSYYENVPPADWQFTTNNYGKPLVARGGLEFGPISFSLSHTRGCVACGMASGAPLGVDIERTDRSLNFSEIANRYFSNEEAAWLNACSDETYKIRFAELWTLKEAFLKAVGVGLSGSLASISFRLEEPRRIVFTTQDNIDAGEWHFALYDLGSNIRLGVAVCSSHEPQFLVREDGFGNPPVHPVGVSAVYRN